MVDRFGAPRVRIFTLSAQDAVAAADRLPAVANRSDFPNVSGRKFPIHVHAQSGIGQ